MSLRKLLGAQRRRQSASLRLAALAAVGGSVAGVLLLGLSGWFISVAAAAGLAGVAAAQAFNYMLPSAAAWPASRSP